MNSNDNVSILLVDDRPQNLLTLEAVLSSENYNLVRATSGKEALRQVLQHDFALVLLDVQMPEMDGFETAALIRSRKRSSTTPIIFVSAVYNDISHIGRGYEAGAVDYIIKPFEPTILKSKVKVFADLYRKNIEIQKKTEALFREQEERAKVETLKEHYNDLLNWLDHSIIWEAELPEMNFSFVSKRAEELLGYPHDQWFQEPDFFFKHIFPEDLSRVKEVFKRVLTSKDDLRCEHRMLTLDGRVCWFHTGVQVEARAEDGKPSFRGLSVDITPLKLEEEKLKKREAKFRRVVDSNMLGHIFADLRGNVLDSNDCFLKMSGYTRADILSNKIRWKDMTPPEYQFLDELAVAELKSTGVCSPYEKEYIRKDGSRVPVMIGAALLEGSESECVCFVLDLTEKRKAEEEKNRAIRAREELLEIVSHDLKNPLGAVLMNAALLYRKIPANPEPDFIRKHLETIQRSAERMQRLIEDLLDLAKVEAGKLPIEKKNQPILPILEEAWEMFLSLAEQKSLQLEKDWALISEEVICDRDRLLQVFSNLIGNAIKFTPKKGTIRIGVKTTAQEYRFFVSDSGPGIPQDQIPHIFDRYWQAQQAGRDSLGLGLSIAKGIIEAHQGRIWVESQVGHGAAFYFTLPKSQPLTHDKTEAA